MTEMIIHDHTPVADHTNYGSSNGCSGSYSQETMFLKPCTETHVQERKLIIARILKQNDWWLPEESNRLLSLWFSLKSFKTFRKNVLTDYSNFQSVRNVMKDYFRNFGFSGY